MSRSGYGLGSCSGFLSGSASGFVSGYIVGCVVGSFPGFLAAPFLTVRPRLLRCRDLFVGSLVVVAVGLPPEEQSEHLVDALPIVRRAHLADVVYLVDV